MGLDAAHRPYRVLLGVLTAIFMLRVLAQFLAQFGSPGFLPPFAFWHSETLRYEILLATQLGIALVMAVVCFRMPPRVPWPLLGRGLVILGWVYIAVMLARFAIGLLGLSTHPWFKGAISTAFHFGLAAFVLVLGAALRAEQPRNSIATWGARYLFYPTLLGGSYILYVWLRRTGSPLLFSAYLSVLVGGIGILLHESFFPFRAAWRPDRLEVAQDSVFLVLVQVAFPGVLKALALALLVSLPDLSPPGLRGVWPHHWPVLAQIGLMLVISEFFRYWLHRALHAWPLWPLHAVHHASERLYTVNVGRFHPLDKAIQFLGDTAPFLLLGVSPEVFAAHFVLYGIKGFYQHSNADVRLGPFNWLIAGPELHRWHHARDPRDGACNYGNSLIIWDTVFGTRFLPVERTVGEVGIGNRAWPHDFLPQMAAPFTTPTEMPAPR